MKTKGPKIISKTISDHVKDMAVGEGNGMAYMAYAALKALKDQWPIQLISTPEERKLLDDARELLGRMEMRDGSNPLLWEE